LAEEETSQEKSEEPSSKRVSEFRAKGQVARSQEVMSFVSLATAIAALSVLGPQISMGLARSVAGAFQFASHSPMHNALAWSTGYAKPLVMPMVLFMLSLLVMVAAASLMQTGFLLATQALRPKLSTVNPVSGFKKLFSMRVIIQLIKNVLKVSVIGFIVYNVIRDNADGLMSSAALPLVESTRWCVHLIGVIIFKILIFLFIVAGADYLYQWYELRKKMMMSRHELKEESKQEQSSPHVKSKIRQIGVERAKRSIQKEVPHADVIVTNPTHYAVALRYRRNEDGAPRVVAKGKDLLAAVIREVANSHDIPIYEYPELARKLYKRVRVGHEVAYDLYEAVARVLAFVYQMHQRRKEQWS